MWSLEVWITVGCAVVGSVMAIAQFGAAWVSLRAAWKIAADQAAESERVRRQAIRDFIEVVASLAQEALVEAEKADVALRAGSGPNVVLYNFGQRLADLREALQPIRGASPPDAKLMLAVGRLSRVLDVPDPAGVDQETAILIVNQHRGSIGLALGEIRAFDTGAEPRHRGPDEDLQFTDFPINLID